MTAPTARGDRSPPFSEDAERGVLGSILLESNRVLDLCMVAKIDADAFYVPAHKAIYEAILEQNSKGAVVDVLTMTERMQTSGTMAQAGGSLALASLIDHTPTAAHADYYIDIVRTKWVLRRLIQAARDAERAVYESGADPDPEDLRSRAEFAFASIQIMNAPSYRPLAELLERQYDRFSKAAEFGCAGFSTGLRWWDRYFGGMVEDQPYFISGEAKSCKTTLARQIVRNCMTRSKPVPVGVFSIEMSDEFMAGAMAASEAKQNMFFLMSGNTRLINWDKMEAAKAAVSKWPLAIDPTRHTPSSLWSAARRMVSKMGVKLFVLDHIHAMADDTGTDRWTSEEKISRRSSAILGIAKELKVPWIVVSPLSRQGKLRGSGMMDYDCAGHLRLVKEPGSNLVSAQFVSNRYAPDCGDVALELDPHTAMLHEVEQPSEPTGNYSPPPPPRAPPDWFKPGGENGDNEP